MSTQIQYSIIIQNKNIPFLLLHLTDQITQNMIEMRHILTRKQRFVMRQLSKCMERLTKFMLRQGISQHDITVFFIQSVFQTHLSVRMKKLSHEFTIQQTEEQTNNSETSDRLGWDLEIVIQKTIKTKLEQGQTLQKILLSFAEKCCIEEEKFKNYLIEEEQMTDRSREFREFIINDEIIKDRIKQNNYITRIMSHTLSPPLRSSLINPNHTQFNRDNQYECPYESITPRRRIIDQTENQHDYMYSFQRSLAESIKKTKLLRNMLQKQLSLENSDLELNDNRDEQQHSRKKEIY